MNRLEMMPSDPEVRAPGFLHPLLALASLAQVAPLSLFARHAAREDERGLLALTLLSMGLAAIGAWAVWKRRDWSGWPVLCAASWSATVGFWGVSAPDGDAWWWVVALAALALVLGVVAPAPQLARITWPVRIFCGSVVSLTRYVAFWGLFFPLGLGVEWAGFAEGFDDAMPFLPEIPPLHARFIGSLYLGATVICVWHVFARRWAVGRLLQALIFLWTFILLLISLRHLEVFDWESSSVWFWFVAYLAFPSISLWIWRRIELEPDAGDRPLPVWGRAWLVGLGAGLLLLSGLGFFAAPLLARAWPWKLPELLAHIYSAPFAAFGIGSLLAAACRGARRRAVVPFCAATFAMAAGSLAASLMHRDKFVSDAPSTWVWFAALGVIALASAALASHILIHFRAGSRSPGSVHVHAGASTP